MSSTEPPARAKGSLASLPRALRRLKPDEVEDVLCIFTSALGDGAWCASELVWMTLGLTAEFFPRARTTLADEACDLVRDLLCNVYFV